MKKRIMNHPLAVARKKFSRHRAQAKYRNIPFYFDFDTWYNWWLSNGVDKNIDQKWHGSFRPCMCRYNDIGPYEPNNVYCATHPDNARDAHTGRNSTAQNYRVGNTLMTAKQIRKHCELHNLSSYDVRKFRSINYEKSVHLEYNQLKRRFSVEFGSDTKRRWWEGKTACHRTRTAAARDWGISTDGYLTQERKKSKGFRCFKIGNFLKYYKQNSIYPDGLDILVGKDFDL